MRLRNLPIGKIELGRLHWTLRYAIAVAFVGSALALNSLPEARVTPFLFFFGAVALSARVSGFGPALFATFLSALAADYFLIPPRFGFATSPADLVRVLFFVLVAVLISSLAKRTSELEREGQANRAKLAAIVESSEDAIFS